MRHQAVNSCQTSNNISCTKLTPVCSQTPSFQQLSDIKQHQLHKAYPCLQSDTKPSTAVRHQTTLAAQNVPLSTVRHQAVNSCQTSNTVSCTKLTLVCSWTPSLQQLSDIQQHQLHKAYSCPQLDANLSTAVRHQTSAAQNLPLSAVRHQAFNSCLSVSEPSTLSCLLADKDVVCVWHETP